MNKLSLTLLCVATINPCLADESSKLIFEDDFERTESQEAKEEIGNGWTTNSKARAGGNKQVDLKDGSMYISIHEAADHPVSVVHPAEFTNGTIKIRFMLEDQKDVLGLDFADPQYKQVHAGHLFKVTVGSQKIDIDDSRSGSMNMEYYEAKRSKTLTRDQQKYIASKKKSFPHETIAGKWYAMTIKIRDDLVNVSVDDNQVASLSSEGFAHPTKRLLRISVPRNAVVDDVQVFAE